VSGFLQLQMISPRTSTVICARQSRRRWRSHFGRVCGNCAVKLSRHRVDAVGEILTRCRPRRSPEAGAKLASVTTSRATRVTRRRGVEMVEPMGVSVCLHCRIRPTVTRDAFRQVGLATALVETWRCCGHGRSGAGIELTLFGEGPSSVHGGAAHVGRRRACFRADRAADARDLDRRSVR